MSCLRHYWLRTTDTIVHPSVDILNARSTRFQDGQGRNWLFLQLSQYSTNFEWGAKRLVEKGVSGDGKGRAENIGELMEEALFELLKQHCASPKWSINLEFAIPHTHDALEPKPEQQQEQFLHRIVSLKPDATVAKVESMFLDPMNLASEEGEASNKADMAGGLEGWEIRDGRAWFARRFPSRAALVEHEEVWVVIERTQERGLEGSMDNGEVCGYITTLADPESNQEVTGDKSDGRKRRVYISSLLVYPSYRRKGLGRALLQHVIARTKISPQGPGLVRLTMFCDNARARGMYLAEGFVVTRQLWVIRAGGGHT